MDIVERLRAHESLKHERRHARVAPHERQIHPPPKKMIGFEEEVVGAHDTVANTDATHVNPGERTSVARHDNRVVQAEHVAVSSK